MSCMGTSGMLALSMVTYCVRMLWYAGMGALKTSPWAVLPAEVLHGITFACLWIAATQWARATAPAGRETSAQGLVEGVHWGMGQGLGCLGGGAIYGKGGGVLLWLVSAGLALIGLILSICGAEKSEVLKGVQSKEDFGREAVRQSQVSGNAVVEYSPLQMTVLTLADDSVGAGSPCT